MCVSAGLGIETARVLAARGAFVVGAARNLEKAAQATKPVVEQAANGGGVQLVELDLASLKSVRACADTLNAAGKPFRSEEHTSELQSLMRISYAVFCLKKKN